MMKKIIVLFLLIGCGSYTTKVSLIQYENFTFIKPANWRAVENHGYISYSPIHGNNNFFNSAVSVFKYKLKVKPKNFNEFVRKQIEESNRKLNIISQDLLMDKNHLGDVYIYKTKTTWLTRTYKRYTVFFQKDGEFYNFNYSSLNSNHERYYKEAMSILESIRFK